MVYLAQGLELVLVCRVELEFMIEGSLMSSVDSPRKYFVHLNQWLGGALENQRFEFKFCSSQRIICCSLQCRTSINL